MKQYSKRNITRQHTITHHMEVAYVIIAIFVLLVISCDFMFIDFCNLTPIVPGSQLTHDGRVLNIQGQSNIKRMIVWG